MRAMIGPAFFCRTSVLKGSWGIVTWSNYAYQAPPLGLVRFLCARDDTCEKSSPYTTPSQGDPEGRIWMASSPSANSKNGVLRAARQDNFASGLFSFRKEIANQAQNELKGFVLRGASLPRHAPMTQNPCRKADAHDTTAPSAQRGLLCHPGRAQSAWQTSSFIRYSRPVMLRYAVWLSQL